MRRLVLCIAAACAVAAPTAGVTQAKSGKGVMCVLHSKLSARSETTGSTSIAKGHTLIKVRNDGTIPNADQVVTAVHQVLYRT